MRNTFLAIVTVLLTFFGEAGAQTKWNNPENAAFPVIQGQKFKGQERERFYHRLPSKAKGYIRDAVWRQSTHAAGQSIVFTTDAKNITVRYTVARKHAMPHMPATGVTGVDLYTSDRNGEEVWLAGKYSFRDTVEFKYNDINVIDSPGPHRYTLFLPLYNEIKWMEIGTEDSADFRFEPSPDSKPIVAYGTSICHGACASRPGMAWSNILQRRLGKEFVNLGFSGNAMLEKEMMELISEIDAEAYIIDAMPNAYSMDEVHLQDTIVKAVRQLRGKHPDTPIILADHLGYPHSKVDEKRRNDENRAWKAQKAAYEQLKKEGVKNLHHLTYKDISLPQDATVEGIHASDYGMIVYADAYEKLLRKILKAKSRTP